MSKNSSNYKYSSRHHTNSMHMNNSYTKKEEYYKNIDDIDDGIANYHKTTNNDNKF